MDKDIEKMLRLSRRQLIKLLTALPLVSLPFSVKSRSKANIVIVGGGFGGATCAKYLRRFDESLKITLIEQNPKFVTCPFSNAVLGGLYEMDFITQDYKTLRQKYNINIVQDKVLEIDPVSRKIKTKLGKGFDYDKLVLSPGIDFKWNAIEGYDYAASQLFPHAWKAGEQTKILKKQLTAMANGGTVIIAPPANPFRCPPGPYERASMIAHYLQKNKPRSKVLILDSKNKFSKQTLFQDAWDSFYPNSIEWVSAEDGGKITLVDVKQKTIIAGDEKHKADVFNIIPPQTAGNIATEAGLSNESGWCPVNQKTFESEKHKQVYVIGDACLAGKMPKSGYAANSQGKVCAAEIIAEINGITLDVSSWVNTCYSLITPDYGISVAAVYRLSEAGIINVKGAGGVGPREVSPDIRSKEALYAEGWYRSITADTFG